MRWQDSPSARAARIRFKWDARRRMRGRYYNQVKSKPEAATKLNPENPVHPVKA